jgi:hypothetical protein
MDQDAIKNALQFIDQGNIEEGGPALIRNLAYKNEVDAWAWLYSCVKTDKQKIFCLRKILAINPQHQKAQNAIVELKLKEAMATGLRDISIPNVSRKNNFGKQEIAITPSEHEEITVTCKSKRHLTHENEPIENYKQKHLPGFNSPENDKNSSVSIKKQSKSKKYKKHPLKVEQKLPESNKDIPVKPIEPHEFNPKIYKKIYYINRDEATKLLHGLPEVNSGMYGRRLLIRGVPITSFDHPRCIDIGRIPFKSHCQNCEFFSFVDCPIFHNPTILEDAVTIFAQNRRYSQDYEENKQQAIKAIFTELKEHGRPLHYEIITKILCDRYPELRLNPRKVLRLMGWHSEKFEWVDEGVYKAK